MKGEKGEGGGGKRRKKEEKKKREKVFNTRSLTQTREYP